MQGVKQSNRFAILNFKKPEMTDLGFENITANHGPNGKALELKRCISQNLSHNGIRPEIYLQCSPLERTHKPRNRLEYQQCRRLFQVGVDQEIALAKVGTGTDLVLPQSLHTALPVEKRSAHMCESS